MIFVVAMLSSCSKSKSEQPPATGETLRFVWLPDSRGEKLDNRAQVAQTKATHKFLFIHTPYYYVSNDTAGPSTVNQPFTRLWAFLDSNKFDFYACGHSV